RRNPRRGLTQAGSGARPASLERGQHPAIHPSRNGGAGKMSALKEKPGATLAGATGRRNYGRLYALARRLQAFVRHSADEVVLLLEAFCARIETKHELRKWNRALEREK